MLMTLVMMMNVMMIITMMEAVLAVINGDADAGGNVNVKLFGVARWGGGGGHPACFRARFRNLNP